MASGPGRAYDDLIMTSKVLIDVLIHHAGGVREGDEVRLGRDSDITLFAAVGNDTLAVERVVSLDCRPEVLIAATHRQEHYVLAYEDIRAVRIAAVGSRKGLAGG